MMGMAALDSIEITAVLGVREEVESSPGDTSHILSAIADAGTFPPPAGEYPMETLRKDELTLRRLRTEQPRAVELLLTVLSLIRAVHRLKQNVVEPPIDIAPTEQLFDSRAEAAAALRDRRDVIRKYKTGDGLFWDGFPVQMADAFLDELRSVDDELLLAVQRELDVYVAPVGIEQAVPDWNDRYPGTTDVDVGEVEVGTEEIEIDAEEIEINDEIDLDVGEIDEADIAFEDAESGSDDEELPDDEPDR
jgi:hypothetical protein